MSAKRKKIAEVISKMKKPDGKDEEDKTKVARAHAKPIAAKRKKINYELEGEGYSDYG